MKIYKLFLASSICILFSCSRSNTKFLKKLQDSVRFYSNQANKNKVKYSTFYLSSITDFEWDKFYIFDEYVTNEMINEITGLKWDGSSVPAGNRRIIFIYKKDVVQYVDFEPYKFPVFFYTCGGTDQYEFSTQDDLFAVYQRCDKNGCIYAMIPERCVKSLIKLHQAK
ncbi:hypothetical protein [Pedobacter sp. FW305-3-2-15-E-R2A2]|uniref:hypothetical protein n=1 Tax=Pedobacter sp. FW305-3-2-15-E-R2A2 TaxID=3140251 RepID=UPI00314017FE